MKPELHHLPDCAVIEANMALKIGADKHGGAQNWVETGVSANEYLAKAERHIKLLRSGEDFDEETNTCHAANAIADLAIYLHCFYLGNLIDDRVTSKATAVAIKRFTSNVIPLYQPSQHPAIALALAD